MNVDEAHVERRFSLYALITTVIVVGVLFFRVAQPFLLPLFLAAVLALLFRPVHEKCTDWLRGHRHLAAGLVTAAVFLLGLLPVCGALILAGRELFDAGQELLHLNWWQQPVVADVLKSVEPHLAEQDWNDWRRSAANAVEGVTKEVYARTQSLLANVAGFLIGLSVVGLGLFYFLAEGPTMMRTVQRLSPLNDEDETALFEEFARVCRGVVMASIMCALVQAALAGIGFAVLGLERVWLLAGLTLLSSLVPFFGSATVWGVVAILLTIQGDYASAIGLIAYGTAVVSTSDNLIRAYVIHGAVKLHPLVALISVLGALRVIGLWGVFIGPVVAAFFYSLLRMLHARLDTPSDRGNRQSS
mgnify:FL=1